MIRGHRQVEQPDRMQHVFEAAMIAMSCRGNSGDNHVLARPGDSYREYMPSQVQHCSPAQPPLTPASHNTVCLPVGSLQLRIHAPGARTPSARDPARFAGGQFIASLGRLHLFPLHITFVSARKHSTWCKRCTMVSLEPPLHCPLIAPCMFKQPPE